MKTINIVPVYGFLLQVLPNAKEEEIACFEKRIQEMPAISTLLESDFIEALLKASPYLVTNHVTSV